MQASGRLRAMTSTVDRSFGTDGQGNASLKDLALGRYRLDVSQSGFATQTLAIDVPSSAPVSVSVTLALAGSSFQTEVVGTTPLAGLDLAREEIAAPVQTGTAHDLEASGALDLSDFLNRRLNAVHVNEVQGNPLQADVSYRGYTASPLLGTPQGLSIFMDGVRLNQPFGDVVSWDLIPRMAIAETTLMPGSNPLFGLNTLGGAISLQTKDGRSQSGGSLELTAGSFGRKVAQFEYGSLLPRGFSWYAASNFFFENGWRQDSPSNVRQMFGKLDWQHAATSIGISASYANNALKGNGLGELNELGRNYSSVYTKPDITANRSPAVTLNARQGIGTALSLSLNAWYRGIRTRTLNADVNEASLDQSLYQLSAADRAALTAAGYTGFPASGANASNTPFPFWRCIAQALQGDEPAEKCNALLNRSATTQYNYGASGQLTWFQTLWGQHNQFTAGAAWDGSGVDFQQSTQLGYLKPDRSVTGVNAFADGRTGGTVDGEPFDTRVNLHGVIRTASVYATDTMTAARKWHITLSGRYNRTTLVNRDRIVPGGGPGSLDGSHGFGRLNPAVGVTYTPARAWNAYASFSEASRAPTSIELGCADPLQPCKLPNAMAGDPPLSQVVSRTWEAGIRGTPERPLHWEIGWFRGDNRNDILFVASDQTSFGYFQNFGRTRRQGVEADADGSLWRIKLGGGYTFLAATYESAETVEGSSNSVNSSALGGEKGLDGNIGILPGSELPMTPRHMLKAFANVPVAKKLNVDLGLVALSGSYARGNENNLHRLDGLYYLGPGTSPGYAVINAGARYQLRRRAEISVQVNNLANRKYYTAAQLGPMAFAPNGNFVSRPLPANGADFPLVHSTFFAPGAPRAAWASLRLRF